MVHFRVTLRAFSISKATEEVVKAHAKTLYGDPKKFNKQLLNSDLSEIGIVPIIHALKRFETATRFNTFAGAKAAGLLRVPLDLRNVNYESRNNSFVIPFHYFNSHMHACAELELGVLKKALKEKEKSGGNGEVKEALGLLRDKIVKSPSAGGPPCLPPSLPPFSSSSAAAPSPPYYPRLLPLSISNFYVILLKFVPRQCLA